MFCLMDKLSKEAQTKCHIIHIGKGHKECPPFKVHDNHMKNSIIEKYFEDIINQHASIQATIDSRKKKHLEGTNQSWQ